MSKGLEIPLAVVALPIVAAGAGAYWLGNKAYRKGKELWESVPSEHRSFLLPFGAEQDRQLLEATTVSYVPCEAMAKVLPALAAPSIGRAALPAACEPAVDVTPATEAQADSLAKVEAVARMAGFQSERRALPPESSVLVFDLFRPAPEFELRRR